MSFIKRRQIIVDKKMQFGTAFSAIAVSFLVVAILIALVGVTATRNNDNLAKVVKVEDEAMQALFAYSMRPVPPQVKNEDKNDVIGKDQAKADSDKAKKDIKRASDETSGVKGTKTSKDVKPTKKTAPKKAVAADDLIPPPPAPAVSTEIEIGSIMKDHRDNIESMKLMVSNNTFLIWAVTALVVLQGLVLFFVLIIKTHRIAGPIYVMSGYMRQIIGGKIPGSMRAIRTKDSLKDFYELFCVMIERLRSGKVSVEKISSVKKAPVKKKTAKKRSR